MRKTVRVEQEASSAAASSDPFVALEYLASGETQEWLQKFGHVGDDVQISAFDAFYEMDERRSRYIGDVLERHRGEDAGDLKRSELNELVENLTCPNAFEGKIWKSNQNIVMDGELVQNGVMNEELVQNGVVNEKIVKIFVTNDKIDTKVEMDLSMFEIGGWNSL